MVNIASVVPITAAGIGKKDYSEALEFSAGSTTTALGNIAGTTVIDTTRTEENGFWNGYSVLILTGVCTGQMRDVANWNKTTGTFTLSNGFSAQIVAGVSYIVRPFGFNTPFGSQGILLKQKPATHELLVEDTGLHTNPEQWLHDNHWGLAAEVIIAAAGAGGQQNFGAVVGVGIVRRIRELTICNAGTNTTVVTLLVAAGNTRLTINVPPQTTITWSSQDGRAFAAGEQPAVRTSDVTGGSTYISGSGVEK